MILSSLHFNTWSLEGGFLGGFFLVQFSQCITNSLRKRTSSSSSSSEKAGDASLHPQPGIAEPETGTHAVAKHRLSQTA